MMTDDEAEALGECYEAGLAHEKAGNRERAAACYTRCLEIDPADHCGVSVRLASMGLSATPFKAPDAYVATLFNQHAIDFDQILAGDLGYAVPMQLAAAFETLPTRIFDRMLDLGCGTGLCGLTLGSICEHVTGVDLSEKMSDEADERAVYDFLYVYEAVDFLTQWRRSITEIGPPDYQGFDLMVATDMLPYIGDLAPLVAGIASVLNPGACVALSCETMADDMFDATGWRITPHQRYAHHLDYISGLLASHGIDNVIYTEEIIVRYEEGKPIPGWLLIVSQSPYQGTDGHHG